MEDHPEYTEFGIKIHKFRLTFKVQKHVQQQQLQQQQQQEQEAGLEGRPGRPCISRHNSTASSVADSLRLLDLDPSARSRRPLCPESATRTANWEFQGFYSAPGRTSTPSSGYSSSAVSRTSSFSSRVPESRTSRLHSADDSAYSEVYSTIEEMSELVDPFDEEELAVDDVVVVDEEAFPPPPSQLEIAKAIAESQHSSVHSSRTSLTTSTLSQRSAAPIPPPRACNTLAPPPPPLPPRMSALRTPARPPYPSSIVRAVQEITEALNR